MLIASQSKKLPAVRRTGDVPPALPAADIEAVAAYANAEKAPATRRAYRADFDLFRSWCETRKVEALPALAETVAAFLASEANRGMKPATIDRRAASIRYAHKLAGLSPPTDDERVRATVRGIRRKRSTAPQRKTAATSEKIMAMAPIGRQRLIDIRDRALLLIGFAGAFRRSELVGLDVRDIEETAEGLRVSIRRSKGDQEGLGAIVAIPRGSVACPVQAFHDWVRAADITGGPVFRPITKGQQLQATRLTDRGLVKIIKRHASRVGLKPSEFAGHSLRAGFLTSAAARGANIFRMADQSRHRSLEVLRGYVRSADLFKAHPGSGLL
jgi:site-specific recombinase XerD